VIPKTKIIATLGPTSTREAVLRAMFQKGLDVVRLNFSHGSHREHIQRIEVIRSLNRKLRRAVKIMQDLEGYRIRIGRLKKPLTLKKRSQFYLTQDDVLGNTKEVSFDYQGSLGPIRVGSHIYVDDGKILLRVIEKRKRLLRVQVSNPGLLCQSKGVNIPGVRLDFEALTKKDRIDVQVAIQYKLDYVAQSFVRNAQDIRLLKSIVTPKHPRCKFFAKVESQDALKYIDEIIDEADGIIVARGDLGICVPIYKVPLIQKEIVKKCLTKKKPVVVATQMLESMTHEDIPTRAEVSDVANAILDGATHLLLSGETAVGLYPALVIDMMNHIIKHTEAHSRKKR